MNHAKGSAKFWLIVLLVSGLLLVCAASSAVVARWHYLKRPEGQSAMNTRRLWPSLTRAHPETGLFFAGFRWQTTGVFYASVDARLASHLRADERSMIDSIELPVFSGALQPTSQRSPGTPFQESSSIEEMYFGWPFPFAGRRREELKTIAIQPDPQFQQSKSILTMMYRSELPLLEYSKWSFTHIWWPNLIFTILAWQSLLLPLFAFRGFISLRNRRRIKHLRCVRCAYSIAGLEACPECGTPVPARTLAPAPHT